MDTPPLTSPAVPSHHDRSTGLLVFGILEIILGCFCLLMVPLSVFGQVMAAKQTGTPFSLALAAPALLTFSALATGLIWLGIGSMKARRWARALLLCFGWMGLCIGIVSLAVVIVSLGSLGEMMRQQGRELPPGSVMFAKVIAVAVVTVMYVLIPGALVLFYRSQHVKLTCEHRNPAESWTDRCPLPVLAMCILQVYGAACTVFMPWFGLAMPLAGYVLTGWPARLAMWGFAAFSLYAARGFYRLQPRIWLIYTILVTCLGLSTVITFLRLGVLEFYRAAGWPEAQVQQTAASPLLQGNSMAWITALSMTLLIGYLVFLRRYFSASRHSG